MSGLHHLREGAGPPLVLLAGIGMSGDAFRPVVGRLASEREVWSVDLPGFGRSEALPAGGPCGIEALSDSAEQFCSEAGLERPHVAGNSLGGAVALELGRRGTVASVTAISPAAFGGWAGQQFAGRSLQCSHWLAGRMRPVAPRLVMRPRLRRLLLGQMFAHPERLTPDQAYAHVVTFLDGAGFHDVLTELDGHRFEGEIDVPVTIGWGTRDALLPPTQALRARRLLPRARHVWLHGCGHVPRATVPKRSRSCCSRAAPSRRIPRRRVTPSRPTRPRGARLRTRSPAPAGRPPARHGGAAARPASRASSR